MQTVKTIFIILSCFLLLGACGNKGPLYLQDKSPAAEVASGQEPADKDRSADAEKDAEKDGK